MFYEMLIGERSDGKHRITELRPDLPPACDAFWNKAMAERPADRFQSASEFHDALLALYNRTVATDRETLAPKKSLLSRLNPFPWLAARLRRKPPATGD